MARVVHYSHRLSSLIEQGRLDGSPAWEQLLEGSVEQAESQLLELYGEPGRIERAEGSCSLRFIGFCLFIFEE